MSINTVTVYENYKEEVINSLTYIQGYIDGLGVTQAEDLIGRIQEAKAIIFDKLEDKERE